MLNAYAGIAADIAIKLAYVMGERRNLGSTFVWSYGLAMIVDVVKTRVDSYFKLPAFWRSRIFRNAVL